MSPQPPEIPSPDDLCPHSKAALDALIDAGFDLDRVPAEQRERCRAAMSLLGMLDPAPEPIQAAQLCRATVARIAALNETPAEQMVLSPDDDDALEALVGAGMDPARVAGGMRQRAAHQRQLLAALDLSEAESADIRSGRETLIAATLSRVQNSVNAERTRMRFEPAVASARRFRFSDLLSIAAMLLIGGAVIWPTLGFARERARQTACLGNFNAVGKALLSYGQDNRASLPMATASIAGVPWWNVGQPEQSNSANFYTLKRQKYVSLAQTACAGNPDACTADADAGARDWANFAQVSYSFQNLFASRRPTLDQPQLFAVAVDRSPVIARAFRGERVVYANENSFNHGGRGQNILMSDGHAQWATTPTLSSGDNIWLPRRLEQLLRQAEHMAKTGTCQPLKGVEEPDGPEDSFLCP